MITPIFAQPSELIFMAPWRQDMQFAIRQLPTQVPNPTTESKLAVKYLIRYLKGTQHSCFRLEPRGMVQKVLLEFVDRSDSDWAGDSATRQSVTGYHCDVQNVTMCNRSLQFMRSRVLRSQCLRRRTSGTCRTLPRTALQRFSSSRDGFRTQHDTLHILQRRGPGLKHIEIRCLAIQQWIREKRLSVGRVDTKDNTADLFTKHLDGPRTQSLARKFGFRIQEGTNDD